MEQLLQNIPMTVVYLDDILVSGSTTEEHDRNLRTILTRLLGKGLRLRKEKYVFWQKSCRCLCHVIDEEAIHQTDDNVMAIKNAPVPHNVEQLRSYLELNHYYHNFLSNISSLLGRFRLLPRVSRATAENSIVSQVDRPGSTIVVPVGQMGILSAHAWCCIVVVATLASPRVSTRSRLFMYIGVIPGIASSTMSRDDFFLAATSACITT